LAEDNDNYGYWIGFSDDVKEGEWRWVNGYRVRVDDKTLWEIGEPNSWNGTNEDCALSFFGKGKGHFEQFGDLLLDIPCNDHCGLSLCEKPTGNN